MFFNLTFTFKNYIFDGTRPCRCQHSRLATRRRHNFIFENIDENLFLENTATDIQGSNGSEWSIPRIHVDDLRHYLGDLTEDLPSAYKRRTGKRDIDTVAQEMGYDDIDSFIDEVTRVAEARRAERERKEQLAGGGRAESGPTTRTSRAGRASRRTASRCPPATRWSWTPRGSSPSPRGSGGSRASLPSARWSGGTPLRTTST